MNSTLLHAFQSPAMPCNPLPFLNGIAEHVRANGTDSIQSDQVKAMLWIVLAQAYGSLATVDMGTEWSRLDAALPE